MTTGLTLDVWTAGARPNAVRDVAAAKPVTAAPVRIKSRRLILLLMRCPPAILSVPALATTLDWLLDYTDQKTRKDVNSVRAFSEAQQP